MPGGMHDSFQRSGSSFGLPLLLGPNGILNLFRKGLVRCPRLCSSQSVVGMMVYSYSVSSYVFQFLFVTPFSNVLFTLFLFPFAKQESPRHS